MDRNKNKDQEPEVQGDVLGETTEMEEEDQNEDILPGNAPSYGEDVNETR